MLLSLSFDRNNPDFMGNAIFLLLYWQFVCFLWKQQMVEIAFFSTGITIHSYFVIWIRLDWVGKIFWFKSHFAIFPLKLGFYQIYLVFCAQQLIYCPKFSLIPFYTQNGVFPWRNHNIPKSNPPLRIAHIYLLFSLLQNNTPHFNEFFTCSLS